MKIRTFKASLRRHPNRNVRFVLPGGEPIAPDFHVTEVGHVTKNFIDCGGTTRSVEACLLQTWVADNDPNHRLKAGKLARILDLSRRIVASDDLDVEVEHEQCAVSQYKVERSRLVGNELRFALRHKKTDCLAKELCGTGSVSAECRVGSKSGKCC